MIQSKLLIKICGIGDAAMAAKAALLGADFIGIVFHATSRHYVTPEQAKKISQAAKENGAAAVGVFTDHSAEEMLEICHYADISTVQLHGVHSRQQHYLLPDHYQRIYVQAVYPHGNLVSETVSEPALKNCYPERDFLLFDNIEAGKGKVFEWSPDFLETTQKLNFKWFLAGGLNSTNITLAIKLLHPAGVDVSTGVENTSGEKDSIFIQQFIHKARQ